MTKKKENRKHIKLSQIVRSPFEKQIKKIMIDRKPGVRYLSILTK